MVARLLFLVVTVSIALVSCTTDDGGDEKTAAQLITEGWQAYTTHDYPTAVSNFTEAIVKDPTLPDAYNGAGWSNIKVGLLNAAVTNLTTGLSKDTNNLEMKAGLAFSHNALKNYALSDSMANNVLLTNESWVFSRDISISSADLRLLLAENYFAQANYTSSLQQVQILNSAFAADVSTVTGQAALAREIERLRAVV